MIDAEQTVIEQVKEILAIARQNLLEFGSHLPTAVLHTIDGIFPIVLPFKDAHQKKALVSFVKKQALQIQAYAITTVTCARVVDSRTGKEEGSCKSRRSHATDPMNSVSSSSENKPWRNGRMRSLSQVCCIAMDIRPFAAALRDHHML